MCGRIRVGARARKADERREGEPLAVGKRQLARLQWVGYAVVLGVSIEVTA